MVETLMRLESVSKSFSGKPILHEIDLSVSRGESLAIVGRSGSGKTTLLSILGLIEEHDSGHFELLGHNVAELRKAEKARLRGSSIGFVFQRFALFPHLSALENVLVPLRHAGRRTEKSMRQMGHASLAEVGLLDAAGRRPSQLSGGEQQRVSIARALIQDPALILADEPTGALDVDTGSSVISQLAGHVKSRNAALIVVTHDREVAERMDRALKIEDGDLTQVPGGARDQIR